MRETAQRQLDQPPEARPLRLGIVGCGFVSRDRHLPGLRRVPEVEVVAVADLDEAACTEVAARHGIRRRYASASALLEHADVEAIAVCVPAAAHADVALEAIEAGKHILVEKPLALTLADADRLVERAERAQTASMVGFNLRWHRLVLEAREVVRSGCIGSIEAVRTTYTDPILDQPGLPQWRTRREAGGGALLDKAVHHVDLWRFLLEDEVDEVVAVGRSVDGDDQTVVISAVTRRGILAEAFVSDRTATSNELVLYGDRGALHLDLYRSDGLRLLGPRDLPGAPRTRLAQLTASLRQVGANVAEIRRGGAFDATYAAEWRAFARAIRLGVEPTPSLEDGRRALQIVLAAAQAASNGAAVVVGAPTGAPR